MNIFEQASRLGLRFPSSKGELTTEQLWSLPLTSARDLSLDNVARAVNTLLKNVTEDSFVETKTNPAKADYTLKLEIVKHIISVRQEENDQARKAAEKKALKEKLTAALADKQDASLKTLSVEELQAQIAALG